MQPSIGVVNAEKPLAPTDKLFGIAADRRSENAAPLRATSATVVHGPNSFQAALAPVRRTLIRRSVHVAVCRVSE